MRRTRFLTSELVNRLNSVAILRFHSNPTAGEKSRNAGGRNKTARPGLDDARPGVAFFRRCYTFPHVLHGKKIIDANSKRDNCCGKSTLFAWRCRSPRRQPQQSIMRLRPLA